MAKKIAVSEQLRKLSRQAHEVGAKDVEQWCRLELGGYLSFNPAMSERITVPEYRSVTGQHADIYGRILALPSNLSFVAETRLRNGVEELEELADSRDVVVIHDPRMCELINEHLGVEAYSFRFSRIHLVGVLSAIRNNLDEKSRGLKPKASSSPAITRPEEEIVELKPNFAGIGINLRALWRSITAGRNPAGGA